MKTKTLSPAALALFRLHVERHGDVDVDAHREVYRELERAGLSVIRLAVGAVLRSSVRRHRSVVLRIIHS
jgi:hypothetical protein